MVILQILSEDENIETIKEEEVAETNEGNSSKNLDSPSSSSSTTQAPLEGKPRLKLVVKDIKIETNTPSPLEIQYDVFEEAPTVQKPKIFIKTNPPARVLYARPRTLKKKRKVVQAPPRLPSEISSKSDDNDDDDNEFTDDSDYSSTSSNNDDDKNSHEQPNSCEEDNSHDIYSKGWFKRRFNDLVQKKRENQPCKII